MRGVASSGFTGNAENWEARGESCGARTGTATPNAPGIKDIADIIKARLVLGDIAASSWRLVSIAHTGVVRFIRRLRFFIIYRKTYCARGRGGERKW